MYKIIFIISLVFLGGCTSSSSYLTERAIEKEKQEQIQAEKRSQRISLLKKTLPLYGYKPELLVNVKSMFSLMSVLQDGIVTPVDVKGFSYFLEDPLGMNFGAFTSQFTCVQVTAVDGVKDSNGDTVKVYKALYYTPNITFTTSVYWYNTRPLVGQKLNADFLLYLGAGEYETKTGETRAEIEFLRPRWAY